MKHKLRLMTLAFASLPSLAAAADLGVDATSLIRLEERSVPGFKDENVVPATQFLGVDLDKLGDGNLSFHLHGWGRVDLAHRSTDEGTTDGDLSYAYLAYRFPKADGLIRLGRFYVYEGIAAEQLDGVSVRGDLAKGFTASLFGGAPVRLDITDRNKGDYVVGGRVGFRVPGILEIGASALREGNTDTGQTADLKNYRQLVGGDIWLAPFRMIEVRGRSSYNTVTDGFAEHSYLVLFQPLKDLSISAEYNDYRLKDYFASTNLRSLFNPDKGDTLRSYGGSVTYVELVKRVASIRKGKGEVFSPFPFERVAPDGFGDGRSVMGKKPHFNLPFSELTPEEVFRNRRTFLKVLGFAGLNAWPLLNACTNFAAERRELGGTLVNLKTLPARPNPQYTLDRPLTDRVEAAKYNNFYELTSGKDVWKSVDRFLTRPWQVAVTGMVKKPRVYDVDELIRAVPLEERSYRHRCVEAWAMAVPWTGFPLAELVRRVEPLAGATHLRMLSFLRKDQAPNQGGFFTTDLWPYHEGFTMAEATNELAFLAVGVYGRELPKQHGAPIRLVTPWKYGFKGIKSIVEINFTDRQPPTFWSSLEPDEYGFWANVNPEVNHPRWSQKSERMLGAGERRPTVIFNGYGEYVAHLYRPPRREFFY